MRKSNKEILEKMLEIVNLSITGLEMDLYENKCDDTHKMVMFESFNTLKIGLTVLLLREEKENAKDTYMPDFSIN